MFYFLDNKEYFGHTRKARDEHGWDIIEVTRMRCLRERKRLSRML